MSITTKGFGIDMIGRPMTVYTLTNKNGASVSVLDYGAHLLSVIVPDKDGKMRDVNLSFDKLSDYEKPNGSIGATIGRFGNRIGNARFTLNGETYTLFPNDGKNTLHGGREGFDKKWWKGEILEGENEDAVILTYFSHDGEEGFPGKMKVQVTYAFDDNNKLTIRYMATSDKDTVVNLTNHSYWNLNGQGNGDILGHELQVFADYITDVDDELIPNGKYFELKGSPLDVSEPAVIGERIARRAECHYIDLVNGFDVNYCLREKEGLHKAAVLTSRESGIRVECNTTEPGIQIYSGQGLHFTGHEGATYTAFSGVAMETQHYPDSPNKPEFPTTVLKAGGVYTSVTEYAFGII